MVTDSTKNRVRLSIDPVTRIEGHLKVDVEVADGHVVDAHVTGGMFRGFESILKDRDPRDAPQIVQRICGVCPISHGTASSLALERISRTELPPNGRLVRNLIMGANYLQSHLLHFYHLSGQDFLRGPDSAPFIPRYAKPDLRLPEALNAEGVAQYLEALDMRAICHEMAALFGGRMPHAVGLLAGGTAQVPDRQSLDAYAGRLARVRRFVEDKYLPTVYLIGSYYKDLAQFGQGRRSALCAGGFPLNDEATRTVFKAGVYADGAFSPLDPSKITEEVGHSWFADATSGIDIAHGQTVLDVDKSGAYSFLKTPLYDGKPMEVGPLARLWISDTPLSATGQKLLWQYYGLRAEHFRELGEDLAFSLLGRHLARAEETCLMLGHIEDWLREVRPGEETFRTPSVPDEGAAWALTEAPRGALIHYMRLKNGRIGSYQILPATLWNAAPRSDAGVRGPLEEAMIGVPVPDMGSPVNVGRLVRAFDP